MTRRFPGLARLQPNRQLLWPRPATRARRDHQQRHHQFVGSDRHYGYQFNANGTLNYVQDTNGNRITAGYNAQVSSPR